MRDHNKLEILSDCICMEFGLTKQSLILGTYGHVEGAYPARTVFFKLVQDLNISNDHYSSAFLCTEIKRIYRLRNDANNQAEVIPDFRAKVNRIKAQCKKHIILGMLPSLNNFEFYTRESIINN